MSEPNNLAVDLLVVPVADETESLASIAAANDLRVKLHTRLAAIEGVTITSLPTSARSGDLMELARTVVQSAYDHRAELIALVGAAITAITSLGTQRRIDEISIEMDGKKVVIKGADVDRAQDLLRTFTTSQAAAPPKEKPRVTVRTRSGRK